MATFDVTVRRLTRVVCHPNAERLELAVVDGYRAVVAKQQFEAGDLIAYIPEGAILPEALIERLGLTGKLAGPDHNRVHALKLRGALSQGIVIAAAPEWVEGQSVMKELGIRKFVPEIPKELAGAVYALEREEGLSFDVENIKAFPEIIQPGEMVTFTEKIHGVFLGVGAAPESQARHGSGHYHGRAWVSSKGLLSDRMAFDHFSNEAPNVYLRTAGLFNLYSPALQLAEETGKTVFILGEAFGRGVQDLAYGAEAGAPQFRAFAIVVDGRFLDDEELESTLARLNLTRAPVLFRGPFSEEALQKYTNGQESVSGQSVHLREGVVVTPLTERDDPFAGRVCFKSVSEAYLLRKGGTEYS